MEDKVSSELSHQCNPDPIGAETLQRIYRMRRLNDWMWSRIRPWVGQRVLEAGCGNGIMTEFLLDREFVLAVDINPAHLQILSERYRNRDNLSVLHLDLTDPDLSKCVSQRMDTIVCLNVLEHIAAHEKVLGSFFRILRPGGRLVLLVPAYPKLFGTLDTALGHVRRYGKKELFRLLTEAGFAIEHHSYLNLFGLLGWWFNGKVLKRNLLPQGQLCMYEKLVPLFVWLESLTGHSAGLSHIIVGKIPQ